MPGGRLRNRAAEPPSRITCGELFGGVDRDSCGVSARSHPLPIGSSTHSPRSLAKRMRGKPVALGEVIEREEIEEREVAQDVDDRPASPLRRALL